MAPFLNLVLSVIGICCGIPPYHDGPSTPAEPLHLTGTAVSVQAWASLLAGIVFLSAAIWTTARLAMKLI
jgi:hypothetical protein